MEFDGLDLESLAKFGDIGGFPDLSGLDVALDDGFSFDIGNIASELENLGGLDLGGFNAALDDGYSFDISSLANELANIDGLANFGVADDLFGVNPDVVLPTLGYSPEDIEGYLQSLPGGYSDLYEDRPYGEAPEVSSTFNAAKDSQLANELIERGLMEEEFGRNALAGYQAPGATPNFVRINGKQYGQNIKGSDGKKYKIGTDGKTVLDENGKPVTNTTTIKEIIQKFLGGGGTQPGQQPSNLLSSLLPLLMMMLAMNRGGGSSGQGSSAVIPALTAAQKQTPYTQIQQAPGYRPGQGGITYFNPTQYAPRMAGGGIIDLARALAAKRREQRQGLLKGRGDGVSDSIPAMIGRDQPARLARGEYVVDARTVAELGNGSTDAGAERLDEMRKRVHAKRKKAKVGEDSKARKALPV